MIGRATTTFVLLLASSAAAQDHVDAGVTPPCLAAAATAETEWALPAGVLAAIGRVESGRWEPRTRRVEPWPWTVNVAGEGRYYASKAEAIADVTHIQATGVRSVDVGCFQVNLMHHPAAFAGLEQAFDPFANARYAARFLTSLRASAGAWDVAVGQYHSAVLEIGSLYRRRVMAALNNAASPAAIGTRTLASAVTTVVPRRLTTGSDPYVILIRSTVALAKGIHRDSLTDPHVIRIRS